MTSTTQKLVSALGISLAAVFIGRQLPAPAVDTFNSEKETPYAIRVIPSQETDQYTSLAEPSIQPLPKLEGPTYPFTGDLCSRYVRLAARDLFKIHYPEADAWDLRKDAGIQTTRVNENDLQTLVSEGKLAAGDAVGFYFPKSGYNSYQEAQKAGYTHVALFLEREQDTLYFADKFRKIRPRISLEDMQKDGLKPVEVLRVKR